jgi:hypothetical protein
VYYLGICLEEIRKTTEILTQGSRCPGQDTNRAPCEYKSEAAPLEPAGSVIGVNNDVYLLC